jgi:hypothetical protein
LKEAFRRAQSAARQPDIHFRLRERLLFGSFTVSLSRVASLRGIAGRFIARLRFIIRSASFFRGVSILVSHRAQCKEGAQKAIEQN